MGGIFFQLPPPSHIWEAVPNGFFSAPNLGSRKKTHIAGNKTIDNKPPECPGCFLTAGLIEQITGNMMLYFNTSYTKCGTIFDPSSAFWVPPDLLWPRTRHVLF